MKKYEIPVHLIVETMAEDEELAILGLIETFRYIGEIAPMLSETKTIYLDILTEQIVEK